MAHIALVQTDKKFIACAGEASTLLVIFWNRRSVDRVHRPRLVTLYPSEPSGSRTLTACCPPLRPLNAEPRHIPDLTHIDQEASRCRDVARSREMSSNSRIS
ncbi:hypothetical protein TcasGA2_TC012825 [Tribolium castaneum]|uniref:Uncharacterized protein n=1 Tax=Tribolium castaneum TaxID=7070 RepID=D6X0X2_TRICA|nr:hypothetical protein TcasGA2_TC012825 [Tribolium castaneum]